MKKIEVQRRQRTLSCDKRNVDKGSSIIKISSQIEQAESSQKKQLFESTGKFEYHFRTFETFETTKITENYVENNKTFVASQAADDPSGRTIFQVTTSPHP